MVGSNRKYTIEKNCRITYGKNACMCMAMFCDGNKNEQHDEGVHSHDIEDGCLQLNDRQPIN